MDISENAIRAWVALVAALQTKASDMTRATTGQLERIQNSGLQKIIVIVSATITAILTALAISLIIAIGLVRRIGSERVEWLERDHPAKKYTLDEIIEIKLKYRKKLKELKLAREV